MPDNYRRTKQQVVELMDNILKHIVSGKTDKQIIDLLKVERAQYYKYKSKLLAESIEASIKRTEENKLIEEMLFKQRLTYIYQSLLIKLSEAEAKDAYNIAAEARTTALYIMRLETEGLKFISDLRKDKDNKELAKKLGLIDQQPNTPIQIREGSDADIPTTTIGSDISEDYTKQAVF